MSDSLSLKTHLTRNPMTRQTINSVKGSGEAMPGHKPVRPKNKNSVPKSLRYDLENALVGLCDVWFEEIKPYLVRNNIKVHVHDTGMGDGQGDREHFIQGSPGCSHLDPGRSDVRASRSSDRLQHHDANCVNSYAMPQTASRAPCRRPPLPLPLVLSQNLPIQNQSRRYEKKSGQRTVKRRTRQPNLPTESPRSRQLVRRLCQTYSISGAAGIVMEPAKCLESAKLRKQSHRMRKKISKKKCKPQMKNASTQTENTPKSLKSPKKGSSFGFQSPKFGRCPGTTAFLELKHKNKGFDDHGKPNVQDTIEPLFKDDIIDIIGEKHEKMLQVLYKNPEPVNYASTLNLFTPPKSNRKLPNCTKVRPWR